MKNTLMVGGIAVVAIVIGVLVFLYGGESFSNTTPVTAVENQAVSVSFTEVASGTQSSVPKRTNYIVTSESELEKLWGMIDTKIKMPVVDFNKNYIVAIFAGQKATSGYAISVSKVEDAQNRAVSITVTSPGDNCVLAQLKTSPYQIVEFSKTSLPFTHEDFATTTNCK